MIYEINQYRAVARDNYPWKRVIKRGLIFLQSAAQIIFTSNYRSLVRPTLFLFYSKLVYSFVPSVLAGSGALLA